MAALGSSGTASHPGKLEIAHRTTVTMLAATPPAIAFVAVMAVLPELRLPKGFNGINA